MAKARVLNELTEGLTEDVLSYISATRITNGKHIVEFYYQSIFSHYINPVLVKYEVTPFVFITYSSLRTCEFLKIGPHEVIIYDQHLGETLNILNRIYLDFKNKEFIDIFGRRIVTECFRRKGRLGEASLFSHGWVENIERFNAALHTPSNFTRLCEVQECFVILHEIFHHLHERDEGLRQQMAEYGSHYSQTEQIPALQILSSPEFYSEDLRDEERHDLACELVCDVLAINECFNCCLPQSGLEPQLLAKAILWGFLHLQWIESIGSFLDKYIETSKPPDKSVVSVRLLTLWHRTTLIMNALSRLLVLRKLPSHTPMRIVEEEAEKNFILLMQEVKPYAEFTGLNFEWLAKLLKLAQGLQVDDPERIRETHNWDSLGQEIDMNTGWHLDETEEYPRAKMLSYDWPLTT